MVGRMLRLFVLALLMALVAGCRSRDEVSPAERAALAAAETLPEWAAAAPTAESWYCYDFAYDGRALSHCAESRAACVESRDRVETIGTVASDCLAAAELFCFTTAGDKERVCAPGEELCSRARSAHARMSTGVIGAYSPCAAGPGSWRPPGDAAVSP